MSKSLRSWLIVLALGLAIWALPCPEGLSPNAWTLFAIFVATIAGFILQPIPMGAVAFLSLRFCAIMGVLKTKDALMGFGNGTIWLIVCAFFHGSRRRRLLPDCPVFEQCLRFRS